MNKLIAQINALGHEISAAEMRGDDAAVIHLCREKIGLHRRLLWRRRMIRALLRVAARAGVCAESDTGDPRITGGGSERSAKVKR